MKETVHKYICELAPESKARLTRYFSGEVEEFSTLVGHIIATLQNYHRLNPTCKDDDPKLTAYSLMTKGANTIMAAFELALCGYLWEPPILFRNALEGFASAWDVVHSPKRFELWKSKKKFSSTDSISNLKKAMEPIGPMYGFLSNVYAHINPINASPSFVVSEGEPRLQFFGLIRNGKEGIRAGEVHFALLTAFICLQLTELTFHQYSYALETIEKIPGTDYVKTKVSDRHRKFVDAAMEHFRGIVENPSSYL
jgi:hypothetical protein